MNMQRKRWFAAIAMIGILMFSSVPVHADTDGTKLQVSEPAQLDIQLGPSWTGVEFQLKTDAGLYPDTITVDDKGILHTELGGSNHYILTCLNSSTSLPNPEQQASNTSSSFQTSDSSVSETSLTEQGNKTSMSSVIFFCCGMVIAIGILAYLQISIKKERKQSSSEDDEEE